MDTSFVEKVNIEYRRPKINDYREIGIEVQLDIIRMADKNIRSTFSEEEMFKRLKKRFTFRENLDLNETRKMIDMTLKKMEKEHFLTRDAEGKYVVIVKEKKESLLEI